MSGLPRVLCILFVYTYSSCVIKKRNPWGVPKVASGQQAWNATFGMPPGRWRKRERPPRSRCGKQSASVVVPQNPSSSIVPSQPQKFPDGAQLHDMYPTPGLPSVATHHIQLGSLYPPLYNPPSFPILEAGLIHTCHHFKLTRKAFLPKLHPRIRHFRDSNHR